MKVTLNIESAIKPVIITDEHSSSSNGIPVAVVNGDAYGRNDVLPIWENDDLGWLVEKAEITVAAACTEARKNGKITDQEAEFVRKFYL